MEVEYALRHEDMQALARYHRLHPVGQNLPGSVKRFIWAVAIAVPLGALGTLLPLLGVKFPEPGLWMDGFWAGLFTGIFTLAGVILFFQLLQGRLILFTMRRRYDNDESRWVFAPRRLRIHAEGFTVTTEEACFRYAWSLVCTIRVARNHIFIYTQRYQAEIVPRRAFRDDQHFEDFLDFADQYYERARRGVPEPEILDALPAHPTGITRPPNA